MTQEIELEKLKIHPKNVRKTYRGIDELAESIKAKGILQNLTVVRDPDEEGTYFVVIENRRLTAARKAGIKTAPCTIAEMDEREQASTMLLENMQRDDLTISEQAQGFQMVLDLGETEDGLMEKTGFSKTTIRRRLNIAKLDQEALQEKEQEEGFQLSLSDLYELEKIKSVSKRNKILRDASSSRDIANSVRNIVAEEKREANAKKIIALLKKKGIKEAPEGTSAEMYSNKWETVKSYWLRDEPPKSVDVAPEGKESLYYIKHWNELKVIRRAKKQKKEPTPEEKRRAERDSRKKKAKAIAKEMAASRREFILDIIAGKVKPLKDTEEVCRMLWEVIIESTGFIDKSRFVSFIIGKSSYDASEDEKKEAEEKIKLLNVIEYTMIAAYSATENMDFMEWTAVFNEKTGKVMKMLYKALGLYGFSYVSDDEAKLVDGTHELYTETEIKE